MPPDSRSSAPTPRRRRLSELAGSAGHRGSGRWQALRRHPLALTLLLSLLFHGGGLLVLGYGLQPSRLTAVAAQPETDPLRFELVETPESAAVEEPRDSDSRLFSNRNTRSQERRSDPDLPLTDSPRIPQDGESHDLRPVGTAPRLGAPSPATAPPSAASRPSRPAPQSTAQPSTETAEPSEKPAPETSGIQVRPEPVREAPPPDPPRREIASRTPPRPPQPQSRPTPAAPPAEETAPPTAFQLGETFRPGKPSLTPVEEDLLARAEAEGEFSFEATQHFFADYYLRMQHEIETTWTLLLTSRYRKMDPSRAVLDFLVRPDGTLAELSPLAAEGDELFPLVCGLAVRNSAPFGPVPYEAVPQLPESAHRLPLRVRATFNYQ